MLTELSKRTTASTRAPKKRNGSNRMRRNCCFAGHAQQTPTQQHHAANLPQKTSRNQQSKCMHKALLSINDQLEDISQFLRFCKAREASIPSLPPRFPLGQKSKLKLAELRLSFDFCPSAVPALCRSISQRVAMFG